MLLKIFVPGMKIQDVIKGLEQCRINPNFHPDVKTRNDLEFYIPQLTYLIFSSYVLADLWKFCCRNIMVIEFEGKNAEWNKFMLEACKTDVFFAHEVFWYINSLLNPLDFPQ